MINVGLYKAIEDIDTCFQTNIPHRSVGGKMYRANYLAKWESTWFSLQQYLDTNYLSICNNYPTLLTTNNDEWPGF
jgi:hypothetical protein